MDQAESSPLGGQPDRRPRREPGAEPLRRPGTDAKLDHPVVVGYDGSPSSRNALAYAAGVSLRLSRPLVIIHVTPGVYCEPLTGQVIGAPRARGGNRAVDPQRARRGVRLRGRGRAGDHAERQRGTGTVDRGR